MTEPKSSSLVPVLARNKPAGKAQQQFQRLVAKIEGKREELKQWQAYSLRYNQRLAGEIEPLRTRLRDGQRQMVMLVDELLSQGVAGQRVKGTLRAKLLDLLTNLVTGLLQEGEDEELEALRVKYTAVSSEEARRAELDFTESFLSDVLGFDLGEHSAQNTEEFLDHARRTMQERAEEEAGGDQQRHNRSRSKKSRINEPSGEVGRTKLEQAAKDVSQSLREVFRKLVSALHPDREPDAQERERKNELMQRVNQAYEAKDLLTLLGLQLEIEQIDAAHLASLTPQRLTHYNQILREQLTRLETELAMFIEPFQFDSLWGRDRSLTVAEVDRRLSADVAELRGVIKGLQVDLVAFRDPKRLRQSFERYEIESDFDAYFDEMADFAAMMGELRPKRRRRRRV